MSRKSWLLAAVLFVAAVVGCGMSKEEISRAVKTSMQSKFDTDPQFKSWHLTVTDVQVLSKGGNLYAGIARISHEDSPHDVAVDITVDGDQVMWKVPPGSFEFVLDDRQESTNEPGDALKFSPQTAGQLIVNAVESGRLTLTDYARDLGFSLKANNGYAVIVGVVYGKDPNDAFYAPPSHTCSGPSPMSAESIVLNSRNGFSTTLTYCVNLVDGQIDYNNGASKDLSTLTERTAPNSAVPPSRQAPATLDAHESSEMPTFFEPRKRVEISATEAGTLLQQGAAPTYPPIAKAARISGTVVLHIFISEIGAVEDAQAISGPAMLQQSAIDAVKTWRYKPYSLNNTPAAVETTVSVVFSLGG
jgi:TonB family protein